MRSLLFVIVAMAGVPSFACSELVSELKTMQKAQQAMLTSLTANHETFARTIEDLTSEIELRERQVPDDALRSMDKTAQAFRQRGNQARQSVAKMDAATTDLVQRIEKCLKGKTRK
jgi:hypothetical protein